MQITEKQVFTIGYGNRQIDDFTRILKRYGIEVVIDVRTYPYSRFHPQFRQSQLQTFLSKVCIEYLFLGKELGGRPRDPKLHLNGLPNYSAIKQSALFQAGIGKVVELVQEGIKVTLMCSEADHNNCHRKHLISDELDKLGLNVLHINKIGIIERHRNDLALFS